MVGARPEGGDSGSPPDFRFGKQDRVVRPVDFLRLHNSALYAADAVLVVKGVRNGLERSRLGLSVSRKVGNAVVRNRWKRLIREAFRLQRQAMPVGWDWLVRPRRGATSSTPAIAASLLRLTARIERYKARK